MYLQMMTVYKEYPKEIHKDTEPMSNQSKLTEWKAEVQKSLAFQCTRNEELKPETGLVCQSENKSKHWVINLANIYLKNIIIFWVQTQETTDRHSSGLDRKLHIFKIWISSLNLICRFNVIPVQKKNRNLFGRYWKTKSNICLDRYESHNSQYNIKGEK